MVASLLSFGPVSLFLKWRVIHVYYETLVMLCMGKYKVSRVYDSEDRWVTDVRNSREPSFIWTSFTISEMNI